MGSWPLIIAVVVIAVCVFYDDNSVPANDVDNLHQGWFAFGVMVRMLMSVAMLTLSALIISTLFQTV